MSHKIHLHIHQPCAENFETFQTTTQGGFCQSCQKEVVDFTKMTDLELVTYLQQQQGKICGRLRQSQLTSYSVQSPHVQKTYLQQIGTQFLGLSILSWFALTAGQAQSLKPTSNHKMYATQQNTQQLVQQPTQNLQVVHTVSGVVMYEDETLPGVSVYIKGTQIGTVTGVDGKFMLQEVPTGSIILFQSVGFETQEYEIKANAPQSIYIPMKLTDYEMALMGEVATEDVYASKPSLWQKIKNIFR